MKRINMKKLRFTLSLKVFFTFILFLQITSIGKSQTGQALSFDGVDDYVFFGSVLQPTGAVTAEAWIYKSIWTGNDAIISNTELSGYAVQLGGGYPGGQLWRNGGYGYVYGGTVPEPGWHHLAMTFDGNTLNFYVDGILVDSNGPLSGGPYSIPYADYTYFGVEAGQINSFFNGKMDEVRIWNYARTYCQIQSNMNFSIATTATGLIGNYHFNQGVAGGSNPTATLLTDASGYNTDGNINMALTGTTSNWVSGGAPITGSILSISASNNTICLGGTATLTAFGGSTFTWTSGPNTSTYAVNPTVTTTYSLISTSACGGTNSAVMTINVVGPPTITPSSTVICSGNIATLTASGATTYTWSGGPSTAAYTVSPTTTTNYTVTATASGCTNQAVRTISVNTSPTVNISSSSSVICSGKSTTLTASGANTYTWNGVTTGSVYAVTPSITATYTLAGTTTSSGCTDQAIQTITVLPTPTVTIVPSSTVNCSANTLTLTAGGAVTYTWSNSLGNGTLVTLSPNSNVTRNVTGTAANGCTNQAVQSISVNPSPTVIAGASIGTVCAGESVTLTASGANTYTWNGVTTGSAYVINPTISATYTVVGTTTGSGCTDQATVAVSVLTLPNVTITPSSTVSCSADNVTLTAGGAVTYTWSNGTTTTTSWVISPNANTTRTVVGTAANGCTNQAVQSISVNPTPTLSIVPSSTTVCSANTVTLTVSGASTYTWSNSLGNATLVTVTSASNYTRTVTGTVNNCTASASQAIVVNATPTLNIVPSSTSVCSANIVTLTVSGASTYTWSNALGNATLVTVSSATNYTRTVTGTANGCTASASQSVLVNTTPTVTIVPSSTAVCSANSVSLTTSGASTYTWSNSLGNATLVTVSSANNHTQVVTGTAANGCTASASQSILVNISPTVIIVPSSTAVCSANSATLTTGGASTYTWSNSLGNATLVTVSSASNYTRTVIGTAANGCTASASQAIVVNATPTVNIVPSSTAVCSANAVTLTVNGASTYTWSNSLGNATLVTVLASSNHTQIAIGTAANGCTASASQAIVVNLTPTVTIVPSSTVVCSANSVTLTAGGASTYTWSNSLGNATVVTVSSASNFTRTLIGTAANGCTNQAVQSISVNTTPTITILPSSTVICSGNGATLTANGAGTYTWLASGPTSSVNTVTPLSNTAYTVVGTSSLSSCTNTAVITVSVNLTPTIVINSSNSVVCAGGLISFTASGATNYTWTNGPSTAIYTLVPNASGNYTVTGQTAGCFSSASSSITVNPVPTITANSGTICTGNSFTIIANGANTYSWSNGVSASSVVVTPPASTVYVVTGTATNNCTGTATVNVSVGNNLVVAIVPSSNSVCAGNSVTLTASGANSYTWSNTFTNTSIVVNPTLATTYSVLGSSGPSCTNTASQFISILPSPTLSVAGNNFICLGLSTVLNASGANTYTWSTGPNTSSVLVTPTATSVYTVSGSNALNCINSATYQVQTTPVITPSLCLVTVDSLSINNEIYWEKDLYPQADTFIVYREASASVYSVIARLSKNAPGSYVDTNRSIGPNNGNPNFSSYKYKVQFRDTCGNLSPMSDYHKTIFIQDFQTGSFSWNYYNIAGVDQQSINYVLYRRNVLSGVTTSVGGTSGTAFTDPQYNTLALAGNVKWFVGMSGFACDPNAKLSGTTAATITTTKSNASNERQFPVITEGIEENSPVANDIRIFPNPVENELTLDFGKKPLILRIELSDVTGRIIFNEEVNNSKFILRTDNIKNGIYFITLYDANRIIKAEKIVVQRP